MDTREKVINYFEEVVTPAIKELIDEYDQKDGYSAGYCPNPILFKDNPPIAEHNGINVRFPNNTEKNVSVCWFEGADHIMIGRIDELGGGKTTLMQEADKDYLKERIRELIGSDL